MPRHDAIIDEETFDAVQRQLKDNAPARCSATNGKAPSILTGSPLMTRATGCARPMPVRGAALSYYISKRLMHRTGAATDGWRIPAKSWRHPSCRRSAASCVTSCDLSRRCS
jgi:hypothetical protein